MILKCTIHNFVMFLTYVEFAVLWVKVFLCFVVRVVIIHCVVQFKLSDASLFLPHELDKLVQIMQAIGSVRTLRDHNTKFRTFVCLSLSRGLLCKWLQMLPQLNGQYCIAPYTHI